MSNLREKIQEIVHGSVEEICINGIKGYLLHEGDATDQILTAFKAHIAECERPDDPHTTAWHIPFIEGCEEFRKALMESLKTSD